MTPNEHLDRLHQLATGSRDAVGIGDGPTREKVEFVCRYLGNRACVRLLMSCLLAKIVQPNVDPRKPYTEIGSGDSFSGRAFDEAYITAFVRKHRLPCNSTTAFLTPVLRNINRPLTTKTKLVGRPKELYSRTLEVLDAVATGVETAENVFVDLLRHLIRMRDERLARLVTLQAGLRAAGPDDLPLSSEAVVELIRQHLACKNSSRLAVLIVAAAYRSVGDRIGESVKPLHSHNAADEQTGAAGDVEITLVNDERVRTVYEMKQKAVTIDDLDRAVEKSSSLPHRIDNYNFVTSESVDTSVTEHAASLYETTGGTEFAILDCLGFLRHFLHLFHRSRMAFLDAYQEFVLAEPDSAVSLPLKEVFLTLRQQAEAES